MPSSQLFDYFVVVGLVELPPNPLQVDDDDAVTFVPKVIDRYPLYEDTERCGYEIPPTLPFFAMPEGKPTTRYFQGRFSSASKRKLLVTLSVALEGAVRKTASNRGKDPKREGDRFFTFVLTDGAGASYFGAHVEQSFKEVEGS